MSPQREPQSARIEQPVAYTRQGAPFRVPWRGIFRILLTLIFVIVLGFGWFLLQVQPEEAKPAQNADGIVVLTGGSSRVSDAMDLLSRGYGKRLLISGVHPTNNYNDIQRSIPDSQRLLACCVDLDRSAINTRSNAVETKRWATAQGFQSLIVVTSNYHMPRAILELSAAMPDIKLVQYPVIGDQWREEPWWTGGATLRLLLSEYAKYVFAQVRVMLGGVVGDKLDFGEMLPLRRTTAAAN